MPAADDRVSLPSRTAEAMVRFGRVEGLVTPAGGDDDRHATLRLVVHLETDGALDVVRDEVLAPIRPVRSSADLAWHADQWTQETIGVDLAELGWEAIGAGEPPPVTAGALARSAPYAVRRL